MELCAWKERLAVTKSTIWIVRNSETYGMDVWMGMRDELRCNARDFTNRQGWTNIFEKGGSVFSLMELFQFLTPHWISQIGKKWDFLHVWCRLVHVGICTCTCCSSNEVTCGIGYLYSICPTSQSEVSQSII